MFTSVNFPFELVCIQKRSDESILFELSFTLWCLWESLVDDGFDGAGVQVCYGRIRSLSHSRGVSLVLAKETNRRKKEKEK